MGYGIVYEEYNLTRFNHQNTLLIHLTSRALGLFGTATSCNDRQQPDRLPLSMARGLGFEGFLGFWGLRVSRFCGFVFFRVWCFGVGGFQGLVVFSVLGFLGFWV